MKEHLSIATSMPGAVLEAFLVLMYLILVAHNEMGIIPSLQMRSLRHRLNDLPKLGPSPAVVAEIVVETTCTSNAAFCLLSSPYCGHVG